MFHGVSHTDWFARDIQTGSLQGTCPIRHRLSYEHVIYVSFCMSGYLQCTSCRAFDQRVLFYGGRFIEDFYH